MMLQKRGLMGGDGVDWEGQTVFDLEAVADTTYEIHTITAPSGTMVDWGDGTITPHTSRSHSYAQSGIYIVKIGKEATYIRLCWDSGTLRNAITNIYNIGENIRDFRFFCGYATNLKTVSSQSSPRLNTGGYTNDNRAFMNCTSLQSVVFNDYMLEDLGTGRNMFFKCTALSHIVLGKGACKNAKLLLGMFELCSSLTEIDFPDGFASDTGATGNPFLGCGLRRLVLPDNAFKYYVANATWDNGVGNSMENCEEYIAGEGFGTEATNIAYFLAGSSAVKLRHISLPSGFGSKATNTKNFLYFQLVTSLLTNLEMHGSANGIPISFSLSIHPLTVASVLTVLETLPVVETTQTLTLKSSMRSTYEASAEYLAKRTEVEGRGWTIAFA